MQGGRGSKAMQSGRQKGRTASGSIGSRGREGEQYQQKDMGAHPAYGQQPRDPDGKDEDYGNRALHRQAGTTKVESLEDRGIDRTENGESHDDSASKARQAARKGRDVSRSQDTQERDAAKLRDPGRK